MNICIIFKILIAKGLYFPACLVHFQFKYLAWCNCKFSPLSVSKVLDLYNKLCDYPNDHSSDQLETSEETKCTVSKFYLIYFTLFTRKDLCADVLQQSHLKITLRKMDNHGIDCIFDNSVLYPGGCSCVPLSVECGYKLLSSHLPISNGSSQRSTVSELNFGTMDSEFLK